MFSCLCTFVNGSRLHSCGMYHSTHHNHHSITEAYGLFTAALRVHKHNLDDPTSLATMATGTYQPSEISLFSSYFKLSTVMGGSSQVFVSNLIAFQDQIKLLS